MNDITAKLRGKKYKVIWLDKIYSDDGMCHGVAEMPHVKGKEIVFSRQMPPDRMHEIFIHEGLHACLPDLDEHAVHDTAESISRMIKALGYGLVKQPNT